MTATLQREQTLEVEEEDFGPQSISKLEVWKLQYKIHIYIH